MRAFGHALSQIPLLAGLLLASSLVSLPAFAQEGQFQGRVTDSQDAVVAGADVLITNQATGVERKLKTNGDALYTAPFVSPGTYKISVQAPGFTPATSEPLTVTVGQALTFNAKLSVSGARQGVTVEGASQIVNTTDGSVSTVIDRQFVENIPLNGRSIQDLISLTPGIVAPMNGYEGEFTLNGQRTESNNFIVDGVSGNTGLTLPGTGGREWEAISPRKPPLELRRAFCRWMPFRNSAP